MICRGGENIYPREVEDALMEHDAVFACAVFAIPCEKWGEEVVAAIQLKPEMQATARGAGRISWLQHVAPYKRPRRWRFVDTFPMTPMGKIKKFELAAAEA